MQIFVLQKLIAPISKIRPAQLWTFHDKTDHVGTIAVARVSQDDLRQAASFDPVRLTFTEICDHTALEQWAGEPLEAVDVRVSLGVHGKMDSTPILNQEVPPRF